VEVAREGSDRTGTAQDAATDISLVDLKATIVV
jgi:hypothetical protein